ncbi:hypothetical protein [Lachnoclostridium sp. Marseille-P6806]|uniref:hypothetical protein n=1 Tax=Lachnoclostridium sp. Marseille-P6806 TaxID=2364793 RepID=UPI00102FCD6D|nr:hypothetical protein [Lachnoclostridium sp. Marseille-P6806]
MGLFKVSNDPQLEALIAERDYWRDQVTAIEDKNSVDEEYSTAFQNWCSVADQVQKYEQSHKLWYKSINWIDVITAVTGLVTAGVGIATAVNTKHAIEESRYEAELAYKNDQDNNLCDGRVWNQKNNLNKFIK